MSSIRPSSVLHLLKSPFRTLDTKLSCLNYSEHCFCAVHGQCGPVHPVRTFNSDLHLVSLSSLVAWISVFRNQVADVVGLRSVDGTRRNAYIALVMLFRVSSLPSMALFTSARICRTESAIFRLNVQDHPICLGEHVCFYDLLQTLLKLLHGMRLSHASDFGEVHPSSKSCAANFFRGTT